MGLAGGVTFLAAAGDSGAYGSTGGTANVITPQYPAASPNVMAVGGTTLLVDTVLASPTYTYYTYGSEAAWGNGTNSGYDGGGGGGISAYEGQPAYQQGVVNGFSTTQRTYPDVCADADPGTGVPIYDSWDFGTSTPWINGDVGGTSLACPLWAGIIAIADEGRAINGQGSLDGPTQTLPQLYKLSVADYHDITSGSIGPAPTYDAGVGYDLASGLGSPVANVLIPALAAGSAVALNWSGPGSAVSLAQGTAGAAPTVVISEPSSNVLKIDLGQGYLFANTSTTTATGLSYQYAGSPTTSQYATIDISSIGNVSSLVATLPGDDLAFDSLPDSSGGLDGIAADAGSVEVEGTGISSASASVDLRATGNVTVDAGADIQTGIGTIYLAADVNANGTGNDGLGTLSIGASASVTSTNPAANAITLRGANVNIDTSAHPAIVQAQGSRSMTLAATLTGLSGPCALALDANGDLYVADEDGGVGTTVSEFTPGATTPTTTYTGLDAPTALAFNPSGNLFYVANGGNSTVSEFRPGVTTPIATLKGLIAPGALAFDPSGDLYVANSGAYTTGIGSTVSMFRPGAITPTATLTGLK
jgi:hypothetical protein